MKKVVLLISIFIISLCINFRNVSAGIIMRGGLTYENNGAVFSLPSCSTGYVSTSIASLNYFGTNLVSVQGATNNSVVNFNFQMCIITSQPTFTFESIDNGLQPRLYNTKVEVGELGSCTLNGSPARLYSFKGQYSTELAETGNYPVSFRLIPRRENNAYYAVCNPGGSTITDYDPSQQEIIDGLDDMNDYLTDDTPPDSDISGLGNVSGLLPAGPLDSLLNIPFQFLSVLTSSMSGTCVPLSGDFVFDSTLTLPCFDELIYDNVDTTLMNFISLIPSAFILIKYFKHLYKKVERAVSLETTTDDEWGAI